MVSAARTPAKQVTVNVLVLTVLVCRCSEVIPLVVGELPIRRGCTADVLQDLILLCRLIPFAKLEKRLTKTNWRGLLSSSFSKKIPTFAALFKKNVLS
ncbi:MAG: hypothetical protein J6X40_07315 [Bacteroidales bacterium]|nr:hypothetical protein [Bacteroidales bacterium]